MSTLRQRDENPHQHSRRNRRDPQSLQEDGILNLSERWFLDPDLTIKDFANEVAFLVSRHPRLVLVAGLAAWTAVKGFFGQGVIDGGGAGGVVVVCEKFPRTEMAVVKTVEDLSRSLISVVNGKKEGGTWVGREEWETRIEGRREEERIITYHTHALPGGREGGKTNEPSKRRQRTPAFSGAAQCEEDRSQESQRDGRHPKPSSEDHSRTIPVADCPPNEVRVGLLAESTFHGGDDGAEGRGMSGITQSSQYRCPFTR